MIENADEEISPEVVALLGQFTSLTVGIINLYFARRRQGDSSALTRLEMLDVVDSFFDGQPVANSKVTVDLFLAVLAAVNAGELPGQGS